MRLIPKNWDSFQHYKDRSPPWIKLHKGLIDDRAFQSLPMASRALAPMLWLLASESQDGSFDGDVAELAFRLRTSEKEVSQGLAPLLKAGFFMPVQSASNALAGCGQLAVPEGEAEGETDTEKETEGSGASVPSVPPAIALPLNDGSEYPVTVAAVDEWRQTYPGVDVMQQLREMRTWCIANPTNRKTIRGINAFVVRWLGKEQDKSGQLGGRGAPASSGGSYGPWYETRPGVERKGLELGLGKWDEASEQYPVYKSRVMAAARERQPSKGLDLSQLAAMAPRKEAA